MLDNSISRRGAMGVLAGGAAAVALEPGPAAAYNVRVRENITTFAANPTKLAALKTGVQVMKQRSTVNADDPTGWNYWASSHGTPNPVPPALINIYNQCQHGTTYFFPWHRAFLYYFEQTLRAASGDPTFNLPYWNWYSTPTIPAAFTTPADGTNPLYHPRANNTVNGLSQTPFTRNTFYTAPPPPPFPGFSGDLEYDPHGAVHDDVGGDMGFIETSAIDPIFWLHHCNVDRLWNVWMNAGHSNPTGAWLNQQFVYNVAGTMKKTAGQVTNSVTMLSYKYDQETTPLSPHFHWTIVLASLLVAKPFVLPGPGPVEHVQRPEMLAMTQGRNAKVASALGGGFTLGAKSGQINFALSPPDLKQVMSFAASPRPPAPSDLQDVDLVLDGVQIAPEGRRGGYSYRVCVAIPPGVVSQEVIDRQCVGQFGSFEISVAQKHMRMMGGGGDGDGVTLRFPLGTALKAVGEKALRGNVPVTFVARHASAPAGQGDHTYVTIKGAHLELAGAR